MQPQLCVFGRGAYCGAQLGHDAKWSFALTSADFHSPVEKECLRVLLHGACPVRSLDGLRIPADWKPPLADGRRLILSCFPSVARRATADTAQPRNEFVAALVTEITVIHAAPGGRMERLLHELEQQGRHVTRLADLSP